MPYISNNTPYTGRRRDNLDPTKGPAPAETAGELNFQLTRLCDDYVMRKGVTYETLNAVVGVFESAKAEFQRRVVAPYEDSKIQDNGDVYETAKR